MNDEILPPEPTANDDRTWFHPLLASPESGEIVVIACNVDAGNGQVAQILQTAIYELREDKTEAWHCGQPFILLRWWLRLPAIPSDTITQVKKRIIL